MSNIKLVLSDSEKDKILKALEDYLDALEVQTTGYKVVCDRTNNTDESIARSELHVTATLVLVPK